MKRYLIALRWRDKSRPSEEFISFRTRFFAERDMRMLVRIPDDGVIDFVLIDSKTGTELMRS